jgi:hypothetical protein
LKEELCGFDDLQLINSEKRACEFHDLQADEFREEEEVVGLMR